MGKTSFQDLTGHKFAYLTVLRRGANFGLNTGWICMCDCGKETLASAPRLKCGRVKSCGCKKRDIVSAANTKHGHYKGDTSSPEAGAWHGMISRCFNDKTPSYPRYGGRGITVCDRWKDFKNFLEDMGTRPSGKTLDRIDTNGNYEPSNCRWATHKQQSNNMRNNRFVIVNGERLTIRHASERFGVSYKKLRGLFYKGDSFELGGQVFHPT